MIRTLAISLGVLSMTATVASANDEYRWFNNSYRDGGQRVATVTLGVPETDDRVVRATCRSNQRRERAELLISYNTGKIRHGTKLTAQFLFDANVVHRERARMHHSESGEGIFGLKLTLPLDNPVWDILARYKAISVNADRRRPVSIPLRGSGRAIDRFRATCANIWRARGNTVDDERDNEENNVASAKSCDLWGRIKSYNSGRKVSIRFTNRTSSERTVMWIDYQGQPKEYARLEPGKSYTQQTFVGHPWMFTDAPGNCKELFVPRRESQVSYSITFDQ